MRAVSAALAWITGVAALLAAAPPPGPASLPAADRLALLRLLCETEVGRDAEGWVCGTGEEAAEADPRTQRRWLGARRGRFVARGRPFPVAARPGANTVSLLGRVSGLSPGTYRLAVTPRDAAGNVGRAVRVGFVVRS